MSKLLNVRLGAAVLAGAVITPAAAAATAQAAPTLAVDQGCYVYNHTAPPTITLTGAGYTPGGEVDISDNLGIDSTVYANAAGQISAPVPTPQPDLTKPGVDADAITAYDVNSGQQGAVSANITAFAFSEAGTKRRPGLGAFKEKTTWSFSGLPVGSTIYGHYTYDGKLAATQAFGAAQGPCGTLTVRKRLYPATPHHKTYTLQVDASKKYSRKTKPSSRLKLSLTIL